MVFCRNLLIYLDAVARAGVLATLDRLLADDGVLFIGHADRLDAPGAVAVRPVGEPGCFAYRKAGARGSIPAAVDRAGDDAPMAMLPEPEPLSMLRARAPPGAAARAGPAPPLADAAGAGRRAGQPGPI